MIVISDAVVHKRAVMIHSQHTLVANLAVVSPRGLNLAALLAIPEFNQLLKLIIIILSRLIIGVYIDLLVEKRFLRTRECELS